MWPNFRFFLAASNANFKVGERREAFTAAHRNDEDRQAYISASRHPSSVIAKAEAWQATYLSLSFLNLTLNLCIVFFVLSAGSSSSFSSSPNFSNCSSPRESTSVFADYLGFYFSVSQPKAEHSRARGYLSELRRATCSEESLSPFCSPPFPTDFLAAAINLSSSIATGPLAYFVLKHLPHSGMDFLLCIFNLSWSLQYFASISMTFSIIPVYTMGKLLDSLVFLRPISLSSCVSSF